MNQDFFNQLIALALVAAFGFYLARKEVFNEAVRAGLSTTLLDFILPFIVLQSFNREYVAEDARVFGWILLLSLALLVFQSFMAWLFLRKNRLEMYAATFSNKGYVGVPITIALFGPDAVFFIAPVLVVSTVYSRIFGRYILLEDEEERRAMRQGGFLKMNTLWAFIIGLLLYRFQVPLPGFLTISIDTLASLNTPLSMLILGAFAADRPVRHILSNPRAYLTTLFRNLLMPLAILFILLPLPGFSTEIKMIMAMIWASPTAMDTTIQAQATGHDTYQAAQMVITSTLAYLLTMPALYSLAANLLGYVG